MVNSVSKDCFEWLCTEQSTEPEDSMSQAWWPVMVVVIYMYIQSLRQLVVLSLMQSLLPCYTSHMYWGHSKAMFAFPTPSFHSAYWWSSHPNSSRKSRLTIYTRRTCQALYRSNNKYNFHPMQHCSLLSYDMYLHPIAYCFLWLNFFTFVPGGPCVPLFPGLPRSP